MKSCIVCDCNTHTLGYANHLKFFLYVYKLCLAIIIILLNMELGIENEFLCSICGVLKRNVASSI
jgi:hypothetical protein